MKKTTFIAIALSVMALPAHSRVFDDRLEVVPTSATTFEVIEGNGAGPNQFWCNAAEYSQFGLKRSRGRLYVSAPIGPSTTRPGRKAVSFSTEPIPGTTGRATNSIKEVGANLRVGHAIQFCRDNILTPDAGATR